MSQILFIDTETTGQGPDDRICQVAYKMGDVVMNELFKPPLPITIGAMAVNHITNKMVEDKEPFETSLARMNLVDLVNQGALFVAHKAAFDIEMLRREGIFFKKFICTMKVARYIGDEMQMYENQTLQYLRYFYGIEIDAQAHDAMGDVLVLEQVFNHLAAELSLLEKHKSEDQTIERMIEISMQPTLYKSITFGKMRNKSPEEQLISNIVKTDRGYLEWLLKMKLENPQGEEDWVHSLQFYLQ